MRSSSIFLAEQGHPGVPFRLLQVYPPVGIGGALWGRNAGCFLSRPGALPKHLSFRSGPFVFPPGEVQQEAVERRLEKLHVPVRRAGAISEA